jgi:hypothetical protein
MDEQQQPDDAELTFADVEDGTNFEDIDESVTYATATEGLAA